MNLVANTFSTIYDMAGATTVVLAGRPGDGVITAFEEWLGAEGTPYLRFNPAQLEPYTDLPHLINQLGPDWQGVVIVDDFHRVLLRGHMAHEEEFEALIRKAPLRWIGLLDQGTGTVEVPKGLRLVFIDKNESELVSIFVEGTS